jgi:hypothetical protein
MAPRNEEDLLDISVISGGRLVKQYKCLVEPTERLDSQPLP